MICNRRNAEAMLRPSRRNLLLAAAALAAAPLSARAATPLRVVATTSMIADAARVVAGPRAGVTALMGPGVDPHGFRQTRADIAAMTGADLVLWHGLYLEAQLEEFLLELGRRRPVAALAEALPRETLLGDPDYPDRFDPHVWMDPALWAGVIDAAATALSAQDPAGAADYAANAAAARADALALGEEARKALATVPEQARVLVTAHDAFAYFGRAYGFEVMGVQGVSTEAEAGLRRIEELVETLVARRIPAVFVESSVPDRNIRALVEGAAARGHAVALGGELYSDSLGAEGSYEGTWAGMIDHNVTTIARALGGDVVATGLRGRLAVAG
jgi:manganese/zinc/iron transport system substrate-binding protein